MSHPSLFHAPHIEIFPSLRDGQVVDNCFHVRVRYQGGLEWQVLPLVHIDKQVVPFFERKEVVGFAAEALLANSVAALALARSGQPRSVVLGVQLRDGRRLQSTPPPLTRVFRQQLMFGAVGIAVGLSLALAFQSLTAAAFAGLATHFWRTARALPRSPAW